MKLRTKVFMREGFNQEDAAFVYSALRLIEVCVPTQEYKFKFLSKDVKHTNNLSKMEIFRKQISGWDNFSGMADYFLDFTLAKYKKGKRNYASTNMRTGLITLNSIYFNSLKSIGGGELRLARTLWHEYQHSQLGFKHPWFPPSWYSKSVPHQSGKALGEVLDLRINKNQQLTPLSYL